MNIKRQELLVAALQNGTVIDHIPSSKLFTVIGILHLENTSNAITIGYNLKSKKMGSKSIIKVADKFFSDAELNQLAIVAPNVSLSIIRDFEVIEKKKVELPSELNGIVKCVNPKCITNNEPMRTHFLITDRSAGVIQCRYCEKKQNIDNVKLL
ncbi:MAG: aspartate carbamoyltransferase regulatory subunit [Bacteroidaceae bacterium]